MWNWPSRGSRTSDVGALPIYQREGPRVLLPDPVIKSPGGSGEAVTSTAPMQKDDD